MNNIMIRRHTRSAIFMHWFNAICWFFLLATGLGLIRNEKLSPIGSWWPEQLSRWFGGAENLLLAHVVGGLLWAAMFLIYVLIHPKNHLLGFVGELLTIEPTRDITWLLKKGLVMTMGERFVTKRGLDSTLPDQGFYNIGQKLFAIPAVLGGIIIVATGLVMVLSRFTDINVALVQWSILVHFLVAGLTLAGLLIHIYMAAIAPEERPALWSMFGGKVPADFAQHHNRLWFNGFWKN